MKHSLLQKIIKSYHTKFHQSVLFQELSEPVEALYTVGQRGVGGDGVIKCFKNC